MSASASQTGLGSAEALEPRSGLHPSGAIPRAFTPGPWYSEKLHTVFSVQSATKSIAVCSHQGRAGRDGTAEANAFLIAAAPELYEALTRINDTGDAALDIDWIRRISRSALAKARGQ